VIELDLDVSNIREGRCRGDQAGSRGSRYDSGLIQDEVIGCFRLYLPSTGTPRQRPELAVGVTGADDELVVLPKRFHRRRLRLIQPAVRTTSDNYDFALHAPCF